MRSKKPNEMRSILLKGFGYAQLLGSQPNKVSADNPERVWVRPTFAKPAVLLNIVWVNLIIFNYDNSSNLTNPLNHMGYPQHLFQK